MNRLDMVKRFHKSGCCGFYLAVVAEGVVKAGDAITLVPGTSPHRISIAEAYRDVTS